MTQAIRYTILAIGAATMLMPILSCATEPTIELQRNPFDRPAEELLAVNATTSNTVSDATTNPYLRAVLVAGAKSVVNFGGVILQIGESTNGYNLLSVEEGRATFSKDGETMVFSVDKKEGIEDL
jgi:hypothetical protein